MSRHFMNDDEFLSVAKMDSPGLHFCTPLCWQRINVYSCTIFFRFARIVGMARPANQNETAAINTHTVPGHGERIPSEDTNTLQVENVCENYSFDRWTVVTWISKCLSPVPVN